MHQNGVRFVMPMIISNRMPYFVRSAAIHRHLCLCWQRHRSVLCVTWCSWWRRFSQLRTPEVSSLRQRPMGGPPCVKARKCDMFVRVRNADLTRHVERDARGSVRVDTRAFRSMAPTGPMEVPGFGVPIPSPAGVSA